MLVLRIAFNLVFISFETFVSLEIIGYFSDKPESQSYPALGFSSFYGNKGDFIALIRKFLKNDFAAHFSQAFQKSNIIKTNDLQSFSWIPGIDFSDQMNYWNHGFSALMITDTAFFRNKNYHKSTDTIETLDLNRMAKVIDAVYFSFLNVV